MVSQWTYLLLTSTAYQNTNYASLRDELIRGRIVVGILNAALSEKLQLDANLTLEKAVTEVRHSEAIKQHQSILRDYPLQNK